MPKKDNENNRRTKTILILILVVGLLSMTVAYAALITNLRIRGTANVAETRWDIHFSNVSVDSSTNIPSTDYSLGTLNQENSPTSISGMSATLKKPNDQLVVNFDIVNSGTIDAKVGVFTKHIALGENVVGTDTNDVITYTITCGSGANLNEVLAANNGTSHCKLSIHYDDNDEGAGAQTSQVPGTDQTMGFEAKTFNFDADWSYIQN